jgi:hypothetical protein
VPPSRTWLPPGATGRDIQADRSTFDAETGRLRTKRTAVRNGRVSSAVFSVRLPGFTEVREWLEVGGFERVNFLSRHGQPVTLDTRPLVVVAEAWATEQPRSG